MIEVECVRSVIPDGWTTPAILRGDKVDARHALVAEYPRYFRSVGLVLCPTCPDRDRVTRVQDGRVCFRCANRGRKHPGRGVGSDRGERDEH